MEIYLSQDRQTKINQGMTIMRIKIVSDGTPAGTRVVNEDTGEEIQRVIRVWWSIGAKDDFASATIVLKPVSVELIGEVEHEITNENLKTEKTV